MGGPEALSERGAALWTALTADRTLSEPVKALVLEACRCADRLERFDRLLCGDAESWLSIQDFESGRPSLLIVNSAIVEARQQQAAFRQMLVALGALDQTPIVVTDGKAGGVDQIAQAREARLAKASGSHPA